MKISMNLKPYCIDSILLEGKCAFLSKWEGSWHLCVCVCAQEHFNCIENICGSLMRWPWLATRCPPSHSVTPPPQKNRETELRQKRNKKRERSWFEIRTGSWLISYPNGQNRLDSIYFNLFLLIKRNLKPSPLSQFTSLQVQLSSWLLYLLPSRSSGAWGEWVEVSS